MSRSGIEISIKSGDLLGVVLEQAGTASGNIFVQNVNGKVEYQSTLSGTLASQILLNGNCDLTSFKTAKISHLTYISSLERHLELNEDTLRMRVT